MAESKQFWNLVDELVATSELIIERPRGSAHPRFPQSLYCLDYGYLANTGAVDGGGVDVWVGSLATHSVTGAIVTLDALKRDVEVKFLIGCTLDEAEQALAWHNQGAQAGHLLWRRDQD